MNGTSWRWALMVGLSVASVACTITTTDDDGGGGSSGSAGSNGGAAGSSGGNAGAAGAAGATTDAGAGGADTDSGTGTDSGDEFVCSEPADDGSACETCAFTSCQTEYCACLADADCAKTVKDLDYFGCLDFAVGGTGDVGSCDLDVVGNTATDEGSNLVNDLGACLHGNGTPPGCAEACGS